MNGLGWVGRFNFQVAFTALFVVAIAYAGAFVLLKSKYSWLLAGVLSGIVGNLIMIRAMIVLGTDWQSVALLFVEWFVVGSVAGLLAMLVPTDGPAKPKRCSTYY